MSYKIKTVTSVKPIMKLPSTVKWINSKKTSIISSMMALILILFNLLLTHSVNGLSSIDESESRKLFGGYRITPKFCRGSKTLPKSDPRAEGPTICMFNHECAQRNGEVVGACMDGFLFGACCQVPGVVDTTLIQSAQKHPQASPNLAAAYETFGSQQVSSNEQISDGPTGSFYDTGTELENESVLLENNDNTNSIIHDDKKTNQFYVENDSVLVSSPSSNQFAQQPQKPDESNVKQPLPPGFSTEIPMKIPQGQIFGTSDETVVIQNPITLNPNNIPDKLNSNDILYNGEFTHSDITHPGAESILIEDDLQFSTGYGPSTIYIPAPEHLQQSTEKVIPQKPVFKPKPSTISSTKKPNINDGYVLVQTITNSNTKHTSKRPIITDGMTTNNIESIESIILMLNETNHGPSYNLYNSSTESTKISLSSSYETRKPEITTNNINFDSYSPNNYYITTNQVLVDPESSTHTSISSLRPTFSNHYSSTPTPPITMEPPLKQTDEYIEITRLTTTTRPTLSSTQHFVVQSTNNPVIITSSGTKRPTITAFKKPSGQNNKNEIIITPTRKAGTRRPIKNPPSTSYVTGPTPPRLPSTISFTGGPSTLSTQSDNDNVKIDVGVSGGGGGLSSTNSYTSPHYGSSTQKINIIQNVENVQQSNDAYKPIYVQLLPASTSQRPHPTVIITPKPTVSNLGSSTLPSSSWTQRPNIIKFTTTPSAKQPSTSYIYSPIVTRRPEFSSSTAEYVNLPPISSNDFDDPGYYGIQSTNTNRPILDYNPANTNRPLFDYNPLAVSENVYTISGNDNRPVFPGYYGPTPVSFSTFNVPTAAVEKNDDEEEETYTSPNDFVNFPPVRNPNLNMSATSNSVTTDFDMSTPAFVEDNILKEKMSLLVKKIVNSLQGNFEVLAELVEDDNSTRAEVSTTLKPTKSTQTKQTTKITTTRRPATKKTPKPYRATSPKPLTTKRPITTTKKTTVTKKPPVTRRPAVTHTTKKPTKITNKPAKTTKPSKTPKPTRKAITTTTVVVEADVEENNIEENEIEEDDSAEETRKIQCGVRPHVKSGRIVGGKGAVFGEWPWQVLVRESTWLGLFTKNKCGGVLITNKFVMTAAHCQPGFLASLVAVFGEFDISGDLETKRSVTKNVKRVVVHRQYDAGTFENDLALLELESVINYDTHIVPICMPSDIADFTGRMATVTGWGRLKYGGGVPSVLQEVQVPIIENSVCQEMFHTAGHNKIILPSFLCAGYANGQKDSCEGDSGGPLVLQRADGRWELAGTVSHGIKCAAPYLPGVYMRTTFYKPWLKSVTGIK